MFVTCTVQYGSYESHVATENLNLASLTEELHFILIHLNLDSYMPLVAMVLDSTAVEYTKDVHTENTCRAKEGIRDYGTKCEGAVLWELL